MKPIYFKGHNAVLAKDQPQYQPLPIYREEGTKEGIVVSCWKLSFREKVKLLFSGKIWLTQMTFNEPLQPQLPIVDCLFDYSKK